MAIREAIARRQSIRPDLKEGYLCAYSLIVLETEPQSSSRGDYASFDHTVPNTPGQADLCTRIVNDLKGWMTDTEFRRFVCHVMDPSAPRRVHGRDEDESREFLVMLRRVMQLQTGDPVDKGLLEDLKRLSSGFKY